ncbi:hypothetical protein, partial [Proteus mirabilis]|uniref:hypothetical protein n=1 Tax=Proteus mirabilis TaxID=584 RepID=UPI0019543377
ELDDGALGRGLVPQQADDAIDLIDAVSHGEETGAVPTRHNAVDGLLPIVGDVRLDEIEPVRLG